MTIKDYIYGILKGNNLKFVEKQYWVHNSFEIEKDNAVKYFCDGVDASTNLNILNYVPDDVFDVCRGILDVCDYTKVSTMEYHIKNPNEACLDYLLEYIGTQFNMKKVVEDNVVILSVGLYDMMDIYIHVYKDSVISCIQTCGFFKMLTYGYNHPSIIKFKKTLEGAVTPSKNKASDSGFDLVLIKKIKEVNGVHYYDTGIQVAPPVGYYFDLVGRSSISKSGYMLANNVGIIDQSYRGNIIVALVKVNPEAPDLELPVRLVQIIPRKVHMFDMQEVMELDKTSRGEKGFGSSGR